LPLPPRLMSDSGGRNLLWLMRALKLGADHGYPAGLMPSVSERDLTTPSTPMPTSPEARRCSLLWRCCRSSGSNTRVTGRATRHYPLLHAVCRLPFAVCCVPSACLLTRC
jgi:hypothetical protein